MTKVINFVLCQITLVGALFFLPVVQAATLDDLVLNRSLSVTARLQTTGTIIPRQQVVIEVEVATKRWFARGTRVVSPTIVKAVMLPISQLAINSTKTIDGVTWASQLREIKFYPTHQGHFQIPPIEIIASVNTEEHGIVAGKIYTNRLDFTVTTPPGLSGYQDYIVSPNVQLIVETDHDESETDITTFAVGEAITLTARFIAENVPGMMLPPLLAPPIDGISIYHKPAQITDQTIRGELTGMRTESFTYIFERAGQYQLADQTYYWWDQETQQLTPLHFPARQWHVSGDVNEIKLKQGARGDSRIIGLLIDYRGWLAGLFALLLIFYGCFHFRKKLFSLYSVLTNLPQRQLHSAFIRAIEQGNYPLACQILYQRVNLAHHRPIPLRAYYSDHRDHRVILDRLLSKAYGLEQGDILFNQGDARLLLAKLPLEGQGKEKSPSGRALRLNPQ